MKNPLSLEECASITRLAGHDCRALLSNSVNKITRGIQLTQKEKGIDLNLFSDASDLQILMNEFLHTMNTMGRYNGEHCLCERTKKEIGQKAYLLKNAFEEEGVSIHADLSCKPTETSLPAITCAYANLIKNAITIYKGERNPDLEITIRATHFSGKAEHVVYQHPSLGLEGEFTQFSVCDDGMGFLPDYDIRIKPPATDSEHGFGLYFVSLVSKYVGGHMFIDSEPGRTEVGILQPLTTLQER